LEFFTFLRTCSQKVEKPVHKNVKKCLHINRCSYENEKGNSKMSRADEAWNKLDADGSGELQGAEISRLIAQTSALGKVRQLFPALMDGTVTREEFDKLIQAVPELVDAVLSA
jgi:hypothetical protein